MPYESSFKVFEREDAEKEGSIRTMKSALSNVLVAKFGDEGSRYLKEVGSVEDLEELNRILITAASAKDIEQVRQALK